MTKDFIFYSDELVTFCTYFDGIPCEDLTDSLLEVNLLDLNERWERVQGSYRALCTRSDDSLKPEELDSVRGKYATCTGVYHKCKSKIFDLQKPLVGPPILNPARNVQISQDPDTTFSCIKVPACDVEIFYGSYEDWPAFRDMFTALYVNHPKMPLVQKLYHLRSKVRGQALGIIKHYSLSGENFLLAWDALKSRFENKRILVDNQLKILLNLNFVASESGESLQEIQTTINDCLAILKAQNVPTTEWDPILVYICSTKLPHETLSLWEQSLKSHKDLPKWEDMNTFLSNRYEVVERLNSIQGTKSHTRKKGGPEVNTFNVEGIPQFPCKFCNTNHSLKNCQQFKSLEPSARYEFVSKNKICLNCLSYTHFRRDCKSKFVCSQCRKNHHTLLHFSNPPSKPSSGNTYSSHTSAMGDNNSGTQEKLPVDYDDTVSNHVDQTHSHFTSDQKYIRSENTLLPTAKVHIKFHGENFPTRAFIDQGSEKSFISKRLQQRLKLPTERKSFLIRGSGGHVVANSNAICHFTLYSERHDQTLEVNAIVVPKITRLLPNFFVPKSYVNDYNLQDLDLADTDFASPGPVDLLFGSNIIPSMLLDGVKRIGNSLLAQATIFGWMISGPVSTDIVSSFSIATSDNTDELLVQQLRMFWEQEDIPNPPFLTKEDEYCESYYNETTLRNSDGRYIVRLPFKQHYPCELPLGPSRTSALVQYLRMEQALLKQPEKAESYNKVLIDYIKQDHMEPVTSLEIINGNTCNCFYLPHHAVLKPDSRTTKLRVVFNASKPTYSGNSLNDVLYVGPTLQADIMTLLVNWRLYKFVFSGDIEKMYRQILVHRDDMQYQRILFRPDPTSPIRDYVLKTVTFGVNCAPFLAIRTLLKLTKDYEDKYPQASRILEKETYVDDILSGAHDLSAALESLDQIRELLHSAGFPLKKIASNCPEVIEHVPRDYILDSDFLKIPGRSSTKMLGIHWDALSDSFSYKFDSIIPSTSSTKRQIVSTVSKLFDPVGWISPIVIQAKMLTQQLWLEGTKWDENVKYNNLLKWKKFVENLSQISLIKIPRWIHFSPSFRTQIHGFCDASEKAYCAVLYLRTENGEEVHSNLLVSKGKVAPIEPVSLPRLELCGAVLLSKLVNRILSTLPIAQSETYLWCDSSIVLGWLEKPPCTWKTYVANRTAQIIRNIGNRSWRHVRSSDNPADLGSRGCTPQNLLNNALWWHGPCWIKESCENWPKSIITPEDPPEKRRVEVFHSLEEMTDILERFSRWDKAIRVVAYVFRFYYRVSKRSGPRFAFQCQTISHSEFHFTKTRLISLTQQKYYPREYASLRETKLVHKKSPLYSLNPFIDKENIIRANGRIVNSILTYNERYPIVLPVDSKYCTLLISFTHNLLVHADQNLLMRTIRQEYYVSRLRNRIKKCIRLCKTCVLYKQRVQSQIMAALPLDRSRFSLPFSITGLDFAGPFSIKASIVRQATYHKGYVCVFVCFSTKAIHLEVCTDLSADSFLAAFTRFVGRRGLPHKLMSDNGTNFVGAERSLKNEFINFTKVVSKDIAEKYISQGFQWSFIPPHAPHMGGLWEAGVKSFKVHFRKIAQNQKYTFEEFSTLLARIEAVLNSRPLSPMTDDPHDLIALTPGHFLRGAPLVSIPEVPPSDTMPLVDRWGKLKYLQHQFALRWKDEYLKELHRRYKWQQPEEDVKVGQMVAIKDDLLPPCEWRIGRIRKIYQGRDGHVRVADVRISLGTLTRPIVKLCIIPS